MCMDVNTWNYTVNVWVLPKLIYKWNPNYILKEIIKV